MTTTEKELQEARDMQRTMWADHKSEGSPLCDECEDIAERIAQLERDRFIADNSPAGL